MALVQDSVLVVSQETKQTL